MATRSACSALDRSEMPVVEVQRFRVLPFSSGVPEEKGRQGSLRYDSRLFGSNVNYFVGTYGAMLRNDQGHTCSKVIDRNKTHDIP